MTTCAVCGERPAVYSAPRGWDAARNAPASAPECRDCAEADGWPSAAPNPEDGDRLWCWRDGVYQPYHSPVVTVQGSTL